MSDVFKPLEFEVPGNFVSDFQGRLWFRTSEKETTLRPKVQLRILNSMVDTIHPEDHPFLWSVVNSTVEREDRPSVAFESGIGYVFVFGDKAKVSFWRIAEVLMNQGEHAAIQWLKQELSGKGIVLS